jgi:hypothetical protein
MCALWWLVIVILIAVFQVSSFALNTTYIVKMAMTNVELGSREGNHESKMTIKTKTITRRVKKQMKVRSPFPETLHVVRNQQNFVKSPNTPFSTERVVVDNKSITESPLNLLVMKPTPVIPPIRRLTS